MKFKFLPRKILSLFVPAYEDKSQNIYRFGEDNFLPQKFIRYINDSGTAKRCANEVAKYIQADGFAATATKALIVGQNKKFKADDLLALTAYDLSYFKGFAWNIGRDPQTGKVISVDHIPFQCVRKTLAGDFLINLTIGSPYYKKSANKYYPAFGGAQMPLPQLLAQMKEYGKCGEILYAYESTPDNPHYPIPDWFAAWEDVRTSSELQKFDLEAVLNGFVPGAILTTVGKVDDVTKDANGKTDKDRQEEALEGFTGNAKTSDGLSGRNGLLVLNAPTKDEIPSLQTFDAKAIIDASNSKRDAIERSVCRLFGVHPVLIGHSDAAVLGNQQAMANASLQLNLYVNPLQRLIERSLKECFPAVDTAITQFKPINYIPTEVYGKLTDDEIRGLFGFPKSEVDNSDVKLLSEKLGVGGTDSLTKILVDPALSIPQKRATIQILFGISEQDSIKLVPEIAT